LSVASGAAQTGAAVVLIERGLIMGKSAAVPLQADFVNNIVLPHFYLFAPIVYLLEVLTAVSLILGIFVGLWAMIGAFQIVNLWLGPLQRAGRVALDIFFPSRADAHFRAAPLWSQPRLRRSRHCAIETGDGPWQDFARRGDVKRNCPPG
jgi:hypothetical protein